MNGGGFGHMGGETPISVFLTAIGFDNGKMSAFDQRRSKTI
jgi:hypothetical protein